MPQRAIKRLINVISPADMFAFESDDRPDYDDFGEYIDEHSFDLHRYFLPSN